MNLRFIGAWEVGGLKCNECGLIELDGQGDDTIEQVAFVGITVRNDLDGAPQLWCGTKDITFDRMLVMDSRHPFGHVCSNPEGDIDARERITTFRSIWARNGERQPQVRREVREWDYVRNIIYGWVKQDPDEPSGYGMRFTDGRIANVNVIGSAFIDTGHRPGWNCILGSKPGPDKGSGGFGKEDVRYRDPASLFYWDPTNIAGETECREMPLSSPNSRPYSLPVVTLQQVTQTAGAFPRTADEQALIDEIQGALP